MKSLERKGLKTIVSKKKVKKEELGYLTGQLGDLDWETFLKA